MANAHSLRGTQGNDGEVNMEFEPPHSSSDPDQHGSNIAVLVVSRDAALIETVRKATPRGCRVAEAADLDRAADQLPRVKPGVLIADTSTITDIAGIVAQFTQHFPELVFVIAGKREDSTALMQLTAAGQIHRFLLTPLSHGQTRLALDSAIKRHEELKTVGDRLTASSDSSGSGKNYTPAYIGLGIGIVVVIGGIWFATSHLTAVTQSAPQQPVATQAPGAPSLSKPDPVKSESALAKEAFDKKHYVQPAGESALDLYRSALALDPKNEQAKHGIRAVADKVLEKSETALLAENLSEAVSQLELARGIQPDHPRLSFIDAQIARERERMQLSQAKETSSKVRKLIADATQKMDAGKLISPAGDNARETLLDARRIDPTDPEVTQAIRDLGNRVVDEARKALNSGQAEQAQTLVLSARQLGVSSTVLAAVERSIAENRTAQQTVVKQSTFDTEIAAARQRLAAGQLIEPKGDSAQDHLMAARKIDGPRPEFKELSLTLALRLIDAGKQATAAQQFDRAAKMLSSAHWAFRDASKPSDPALAQVEEDLKQARAQFEFKTNVVSTAQLTRTNTVAPVYPDKARKTNAEGWVEVEFTVTDKGDVIDAEVRNSSPEGVFDAAALKAIKQWRFEPIERDGKKVPQRAVVRLKFEAPK